VLASGFGFGRCLFWAHRSSKGKLQLRPFHPNFCTGWWTPSANKDDIRKPLADAFRCLYGLSWPLTSSMLRCKRDGAPNLAASYRDSTSLAMTRGPCRSARIIRAAKTHW
jgi:hypothetical protein